MTKQKQTSTAATKRTRKAPAKRKRTQVVKSKNNQQAKSETKTVEQRTRAELEADVERALCKVTGVESNGLAQRIICQMKQSIVWGRDDEDSKKLMAAIELMAGMAPSSTPQAMLAVETVVVHETALTFLKSALRDDQTAEGRDSNVNRATRLMRLFNDQLELMEKLKGRTGQQKVTVEHVHVNEGGQAIVGAVDGKGGGGQ